jgi:mono/diheme cytochrome c family protein
MTLFAQTGCAACHGAEGLGTAAGPRIATDELALPAFIASVRRPQRTMPGFGPQVLADQALTQIYAYLQSHTAATAKTGRPEAGARLHAAYGCYSCHANDAQGAITGPRLGPDPITLARFSWYVRQPTATMPPYSTTVVSDQDLADIYAFVAAQPRPPPVASIPLLAP